MSRMSAASPSARRSANRFRPRLEPLEDRRVPAHLTHDVAIVEPILASQAIHSPLPSLHAAEAPTPIHVVHAAKKLTPIQQETLLLPGTWRVNYVVQGFYGPAPSSMIITFVGPRTPHRFVATTVVTERTPFGPVSYRFTSGGYWAFVRTNLVRLTITYANPTTYLGHGITVMDGEFLGVSFLSKTRFKSSGHIFTKLH